MGDLGSIPGRDRPKSLKQVVTALLPNVRQQVWSLEMTITLTDVKTNALTYKKYVTNHYSATTQKVSAVLE